MNSLIPQATYYTKSAMVALLAAGIAYIINQWGRSSCGRIADSLVSPVVEELLKSLLALYFAASLWQVHLGFGLIEALMDTRHRRRAVAAILAILTHVVFGIVTLLIWPRLGLYAGISASVLLHMLWNSVVYDLVNLQRKE